jgi:hypothetical protein
MDDIHDHGTLDNGSSEITEALHIPTCKVTYHATNRRGFTTQILDQLQHIDSLSIYSLILESKGISQSPPSNHHGGRTYSENGITRGLSPRSGSNAAVITISKHPQSAGMAISMASSKFSALDLVSAMLSIFCV